MKTKPLLFNRLKDHFGGDPSKLPVVGQNYAFYERANVHLAIDELSEAAKTPPKLTGIVDIDDRSPSLAKLSRRRTARYYDEGPVEFVDEPLPGGRRLSCVKRGLYFFQDNGKSLALFIAEQQYVRSPGITAEVMATTKEYAENFIHRLTKMVRHGKAFRGHVLSLERDCYGGTTVQFHALPQVDREHVILPEKLLDRIERHTIAFSAHAKRLAASGRHLKRGILLYGPPGTGKTYSAMYLAARMPGRTVFLLTGAGMGSIETACNMARILEPATIILEDVDLIGTQRDRQLVDANALLFELLNQMDGLANDADILFILTTNRPDVLEPALAARPGRIDQAIEVPPPDEDCRRRLFELYSQGLTLKIAQLDDFIKRTDGASAAFIRELLRKAAVIAAIETDGELIVKDEHIHEALAELLVAGGPLTKSLLGAKNSAGD
jgi:hypothetical protein